MANPFLKQGFVSVLGGVNTALAPSLLPDSQYTWGENVSSRGGLLHTRPRFYRYGGYIPEGKFQGGFTYRSREGDYFAFVVAGTLYLLNISTYQRFNCGSFPTIDFDRAYFCQADRFLIIQNGIYRPVENWPIIMDGHLVMNNGELQILDGDPTAWIRLSAIANYDAKRVPIGTHMAYGHGRLFVVVSRLWDNGLISGTAQWISTSRNQYFVAGDVIKPDNADEVLAFTDQDYWANGGAMSLPVESGEIKAFQFFRNSSSGTGAGELIAFGEHGVSAFAVGAPRDQWQTISMAQVLFTGSGAASDRAVVPVNDDLAFRADDGIRFVRYSASNMSPSNGSLSNLPQSMEIQPILDQDNYDERVWSSMCLCDNRLISTSYGDSDSNVNNSIFFDALVPLDTYVVGATGPSSQLMARSTPAYDGIWTGLRVLQVLTAPLDNKETMFMFCRVDDTRNELWYMTDDYMEDGLSDRPLCRVITRELDFGTPTDPKEFKYCELWVKDLYGDVSFTVYWRPDSYALWSQTSAQTVHACRDGKSQQRWCLRFAVPPDYQYFDKATDRDTRKGFSFQFCLAWKGIATIEKTVFYANPQPASSPNLGCADQACALLAASDSTGMELDELAYTVSVLDPLTDLGERVAPVRPRGATLIWVSEPYFEDGVWWVDYEVAAGDPGEDAFVLVPEVDLDLGAHAGTYNFPGQRAGLPIDPLQLPPLTPGEPMTVKEPVSPPAPGNVYYYTQSNDPTKKTEVTVPATQEAKAGDPQPADGDQVSVYTTMSVPSTVRRTIPFTVNFTARQTVTPAVWVEPGTQKKDKDGNLVFDASKTYTTYVKKSVLDAAARRMNLALVDPQGDLITSSSPEVTWGEFGNGTASVSINGGAVDHTTQMTAVASGTLSINGTSNSFLITGAANMSANSPVALQITAGGIQGTWESLVLQNTASGTTLDWTCTKTSDTSNLLSLSAMSGSIVGPGSTTLTLTLGTPTPAVGSYTAVFKFSSPGISDVNVTVNLTVTPVYSSYLTPHTVGSVSTWGAFDLTQNNALVAVGTPYVGLRWHSVTGHATYPRIEDVRYYASDPGGFDNWTGAGWYVMLVLQGMTLVNGHLNYRVGTVSFNPTTGAPSGSVSGCAANNGTWGFWGTTASFGP